ncbi:MAG: hypothetical protein JXD22_09770 [Sedimentisphaerales bacterium]|nr:hypothetical protein [Sedimentisphaerales bacterium]
MEHLIFCIIWQLPLLSFCFAQGELFKTGSFRCSAFILHRGDYLKLAASAAQLLFCIGGITQQKKQELGRRMHKCNLLENDIEEKFVRSRKTEEGGEPSQSAV